MRARVRRIASQHPQPRRLAPPPLTLGHRPGQGVAQLRRVQPGNLVLNRDRMGWDAKSVPSRRPHPRAASNRVDLQPRRVVAVGGTEGQSENALPQPFPERMAGLHSLAPQSAGTKHSGSWASLARNPLHCLVSQPVIPSLAALSTRLREVSGLGRFLRCACSSQGVAPFRPDGVELTLDRAGRYRVSVGVGGVP